MSLQVIATLVAEVDGLYQDFQKSSGDVGVLKLAVERGLLQPEELELAQANEKRARTAWYERLTFAQPAIKAAFDDAGIDTAALKRWL